MERTLLDEKENIPNLNMAKMAKPPGLKPTTFQYPVTPTNNKMANQKLKVPKVKPQKSINTSVRAGDWVCLICNNLNFSFRNECNRCGMQTKKQNYIQSLMLMTDSQKMELRQQAERMPLKDLTNRMTNGMDPDSMKENYSENDSIDEDSPSEGKPIHLPHENVKTSEFELFGSNFGFANAILLTPPKAKQSQQVINRFDFTDSNNKDFPPYRSPKELPSVSPILRKVVSTDANKDSSLSFLTNKLIFEEPPQELIPPKPRKTVSCTDDYLGYFNLDEINHYITESFKSESGEKSP
jgi:hypothetical protein